MSRLKIYTRLVTVLFALHGQASLAVEAASKVFLNARVYTVNAAQPWAEAVAVSDDKIVYVGDGAGVQAYVGDDTETFDLKGKMLLPGFVSGHDHLVASMWVTQGVDLFSATSKEETLQQIKDYVAAHPNEQVYVGIGWNEAFIGHWPTAEELDSVIPDKPAVIIDYTIHQGWLNSRAMELAGIDRNTPDPIPGVSFFLRDTEGNPTGTAKEFAWADAYVKSGAWDPEEMIPESQQYLYGEAVKRGYTTAMIPGILTPNLMNTEGMFADYRKAMAYLQDLDERGELSLRSMVLPFYKHPDTDSEKFARDTLALKKQYDTDMLRISAVKLHPEGTWSGKSVLMVEPFADEPDNYGSANINAEKMKEIILACNAAGLDVHTHVEGDGSARNWIDAIEVARKAGYTDARNSLIHLMEATPSDVERIKKLDIPVNITPLFSIAWSGQDIGFDRIMGKERVQNEVSVYPELFANGNKISISADMPGSTFEYMGPLASIQIAMTHKDPLNPDAPVYPAGRKGISLEDALKAVTIYPAWQMRMENRIGSLEVGKYADLVVLDKNLFDVPVEDIHNVKVMGTILNGDFTFRDGL